MNCVICGKVIPKQRLKMLPETETCVKCSEVKPVVGVPHLDTDLVIISDSEKLCDFSRPHNFTRG